jgi:hypothetical protein
MVETENFKQKYRKKGNGREATGGKNSQLAAPAFPLLSVCCHVFVFMRVELLCAIHDQ